MVKTPVLFITFARPEYARKTFEGIKAAKPQKLYFYSNKGRVEKEGEIERNDIIRSYVNEIDWECELKIWFRDECVNAYDSLKGAISWLFENESQGIILEEDCVPTLAFFSFVDCMIEKFKDNKDVWYISGDNFYDLNPSGTDYIFSRYHWMYGWATWSNRWNRIKWGDFNIQEFLDKKISYKLYKTKLQGRNREAQIYSIKDMLLKTNCWDYGFGLTIDYNMGFGAFPKTQLIHNIGLSGEHHGKPTTSFVNVKPQYTNDEYIIENEPSEVKADMEFDYQFHNIRRMSMSKRVIMWKKIIRFFLSENNIYKLKKRLKQ